MKTLFLSILAVVMVFVLAACGPSATAQPPTIAVEPTRTSAPPIVITATSAPTNTPAATNTVPPTNTPGPTVAGATNTPQPPTATVPPPTATRPAATSTATAIALKYGAPELLEPNQGASRVAGSDDLVFKWKPVGDLGPKECYQLQVTIVNPVDNEFAGQSYLTGCNHNSGSGNLQLVLSRKQTGQDYVGLLAIATRLTAAPDLKVQWFVRVVLDQGSGKVAPLSPPSQQFEFKLRNP